MDILIFLWQTFGVYLFILWPLAGVPAILTVRRSDIRIGRYVDGYKRYTWSRRSAIITVFFACLLGPCLSVSICGTEFCCWLGQRGFWNTIKEWLDKDAP